MPTWCPCTASSSDANLVPMHSILVWCSIPQHMHPQHMPPPVQASFAPPLASHLPVRTHTMSPPDACALHHQDAPSHAAALPCTCPAPSRCTVPCRCLALPSHAAALAPVSDSAWLVDQLPVPRADANPCGAIRSNIQHQNRGASHTDLV